MPSWKLFPWSIPPIQDYSFPDSSPYPDLSVSWCPGLCPLVLFSFVPTISWSNCHLCGLLMSSSPYPQSAPLTEAESQMGHYAVLLDVFTQCAGYECHIKLSWPEFYLPVNDTINHSDKTDLLWFLHILLWNLILSFGSIFTTDKLVWILLGFACLYVFLLNFLPRFLTSTLCSCSPDS